MRLQSRSRVTVKNKVIGGAVPLVCLPLVADKEADLLQQADELKDLAPDLLEWRIDGYGPLEDIDACLIALEKLQASIRPIPLIFTCRCHAEGGIKEISPEERLQIIMAAIGSGGVDIVDIEMCNDPSFIKSVRNAAQKYDTKLILSFHNFTETPEENRIHAKLLEAQHMGADIAKVAVMPKDYDDVLTLLRATLRARTGDVEIPIVSMSMGTEGVVTRVAGGLFGSDITFAIGKSASAPGQIPIGELRRAMCPLYGETPAGKP